MLYIRRFFLIIIILFALTSCAARGSEDFAFLRRDAEFDMVFSPSLTVHCTKSGDEVRITFPEASEMHSAEVIYSCGAVSVRTADCEIPLSPDAAEHLTEIIDLLYPSDASSVTMVGEEHILTKGDTSLTVSSEGVPTLIRAVGALGRERTVKIVNYIEKNYTEEHK